MTTMTTYLDGDARSMAKPIFNNLFTYSYLTRDGIEDALGFEECTLIQSIGKLPKGTECDIYIDILNQEARFWLDSDGDNIVVYKLSITVDSSKEIESEAYKL
jgi:hypothetical protein